MKRHVVSRTDANILTKYVMLTASKYGWNDIDRPQSALLAVLRNVWTDGQVRLTLEELESCLYSAGLAYEDGFWEDGDYAMFLARMVPSDYRLDDFFFFLRNRSDYV